MRKVTKPRSKKAAAKDGKAKSRPRAKAAAKRAVSTSRRAAPSPAPWRGAATAARTRSAGTELPATPAAEAAPRREAPARYRREYRKWKERLIALRHRLLAESTHLEEEGLKALEQEVSVDHMADFGSDSYEQETTLQLIESNTLTLRDVDDSLRRIEQGTYGLCDDCEGPIPFARLEVLPHARFCIACQAKREGGAA